MKTTTKVKLAWRFRRPLWKYRALIPRRHRMGALAMAGGAAAAVILMAWGGACVYKHSAASGRGVGQGAEPEFLPKGQAS